MEKEKLKKEEREKFLLERDLKRKKEMEMRSEAGDMTIPRSRFDDSEEEEDDEEEEVDDSVETIIQPASKQYSRPTIVPSAQSLEDMVIILAVDFYCKF